MYEWRALFEIEEDQFSYRKIVRFIEAAEGRNKNNSYLECTIREQWVTLEERTSHQD